MCPWYTYSTCCSTLKKLSPWIQHRALNQGKQWSSKILFFSAGIARNVIQNGGSQNDGPCIFGISIVPFSKVLRELAGPWEVQNGWPDIREILGWSGLHHAKGWKIFSLTSDMKDLQMMHFLTKGEEMQPRYVEKNWNATMIRVCQRNKTAWFQRPTCINASQDESPWSLWCPAISYPSTRPA